MSFYTSLSGLKGAQTDMSVISNNIANASSTGFKRSRAQFGDLFASSPTQSTRMVAGQGQRLNGIIQQFTQGTLEASEKTLDLAIAGEGMFVVKGEPPREQVTYTRNGAFTPTDDGHIVDTTGQKLQLLPVDASGNVTAVSYTHLDVYKRQPRHHGRRARRQAGRAWPAPHASVRSSRIAARAVEKCHRFGDCHGIDAIFAAGNRGAQRCDTGIILSLIHI